MARTNLYQKKVTLTKINNKGHLDGIRERRHNFNINLKLTDGDSKAPKQSKQAAGKPTTKRASSTMAKDWPRQGPDLDLELGTRKEASSPSQQKIAERPLPNSPPKIAE